MRVRLAIAPVVLAAAATSLVACSSSSKSGNGSTASSGSSSSSSSMPSSGGSSSSSAPSTGSGGGGSNAAFCADLKTMNAQVANLTSKLSDPSSLKSALDQEAAYLEKLKNDAPSEMASTISDLENLFKQAQSALSGSTPDMSKLQGLATQLPTDIAKFQQYATANCK